MNRSLQNLIINKVLARRILSRLKSFHNLHKGETCYIFGDGPSVKWFDITKFGDHCGICCGLLPFHKDYQKLNVKYCLTVEPWLFSKVLGQTQTIIGLRKIASEYRNV